MGRGKTAAVGDTRTAPNGYHYTKCEEGWRLTHHLTMEKHLGRPLADDEIVQFVGSKSNYMDPKNLRVIKKRTSSLRKRLAVIESRMQELQAEKEGIEAKLNIGQTTS